VLAALKSIGDLLGERTLFRPGLEAGERGGEPPAGAEIRVHGTSEGTSRTGQHSERVFPTSGMPGQGVMSSTKATTSAATRSGSSQWTTCPVPSYVTSRDPGIAAASAF
jgi:hypothetical protein